MFPLLSCERRPDLGRRKRQPGGRNVQPPGRPSRASLRLPSHLARVQVVGRCNRPAIAVAATAAAHRVEIPRGQGEVGVADARGELCSPLVSRALSARRCPSSIHAVSLVRSAPAAMSSAAWSALRCHSSLFFAGVEAEGYPGPFGQQVAAAVGNLPQLGYRGLHVERLLAYEAANSLGELCRGDRRRAMAIPRTVPRIEQTF
jgi:hypothetical protein